MESNPQFERWKITRQRSLSIAKLLSAEDACAQSMPDASPIKWHLAHTTWFFETFILEKFHPEFRAFNCAFKMLFNSYYNGVGEQFSRPQRGLLTRPDLDEVLQYRQAVDQMMQKICQQSPSPQLAQLIELGIQHEQQHQELMLTDVKHLLSCNPMHPALLLSTQDAITDQIDAVSLPVHWQRIESGLQEIGYQGQEFCFDNETPRHRQFVEDFFLASRLVTNGEYVRFVEDGGYNNPSLWLSDGWSWIRQERIQHPLYWKKPGTQWKEFTLYGSIELDFLQPVCHLSFFEASAYAAWIGARLPTEAEWEIAARNQPALLQLFDCCWQWTSSSYSPYPGYAGYVPDAGALGEYNGKFMANQYVLRGSSAFTPASHSRPTYRNFFPATARWQRAGIRLAKSGSHEGLI